MDISTPALLFPAIAILMLGYVNRYIGAAGVVRTFKKDYDEGYKHIDVAKQVKIMRRRISLLRVMLFMGTSALLVACATMLFVYLGLQELAGATFGVAVGAMIFSLLFSLYETGLSNDSLNIEIQDILRKEQKKS
jgi:hypothetical protein